MGDAEMSEANYGEAAVDWSAGMAQGQEILESNTLCSAAKDGCVLQASGMLLAAAIVPAHKEYRAAQTICSQFSAVCITTTAGWQRIPRQECGGISASIYHQTPTVIQEKNRNVSIEAISFRVQNHCT